jgi:lipid A 3-O-deacylase
MMINMRPLIVLFSAVLSITAGDAWADSQPRYDTFTFYWENDLFAKTDRYYTNGLKLTWSTPYREDHDSSHLPAWSLPVINRLPGMGDGDARRSVSITLGQEIYTPANTRTSEDLPNDRPYAGYTYFSTGYHSIKGNVRSNWELQAGVIGPLSLADKATNLVHRTIGVHLDHGWSYQLRNEPGLEAVTEYQWRIAPADAGRGFNYDFVPHLGAAFGNVRIYVNTGAEFRIGWDVPPDFGTCPIRPGCESNTADEAQRTGKRFSMHLFTAFDGRAVARDIFLDGNTYQNSPHVRKKPFVADFSAGFALERGRLKASYAYVLRTREFKAQQDNHIFGSVNISWTY